MPNWMARPLLLQRTSAGSKPGSSGAREPAAVKKPWWRFWHAEPSAAADRGGR
jgi:hypothetical protein